MTDYTATPSSISYDFGASGSTSSVDGTFPPNGRCAWTMSGDFAGLGVVGWKIVVDADGSGDLFAELDFWNPGQPLDPTWTADPTVSHIAMHNSYDAPGSYIHVDGPTHYEHEFFWPGDPWFGGFDFTDPVDDLIVSLAASQVFGDLRAVFANTETVTVSRFDLVLYTTPLSPCYQTLTTTFDSAFDPAHVTANAADDVVLRDGDSATYATGGSVNGYLDTYTGPTATDLTVGVVAAGDSGVGTDFDVELISGRGNVPHILISTPTLSVPQDAASSTYAYTFTDSDFDGTGYTLADVVARLAGSDPEMAIVVELPGGSGVQVSEVWVRVGHKCYRPAPLRRYPHLDGFGQGPRRYPNPPRLRPPTATPT